MSAEMNDRLTLQGVLFSSLIKTAAGLQSGEAVPTTIDVGPDPNHTGPEGGAELLRITSTTEKADQLLACSVACITVLRAFPDTLQLQAALNAELTSSYCLVCPSPAQAEMLETRLKTAAAAAKDAVQACPSSFVAKTDSGSAALYFHYYGMLEHQQNMLQDLCRTGHYYYAIHDNRPDFEGKAIMDVGAGSGILSLFAAQAGARVVYAVEASKMAHSAQKLAQHQGVVGERVKVVPGKVEEISVPEKVDVLVSEPMGMMLVNERMLESYIIARDRFLKPGGRMYPRQTAIYVAAFQDDVLYNEIAAKAGFWANTNFYGVDVSVLHADASLGYFSQTVVDAFDPSVLVSNYIRHPIDLGTVKAEELLNIVIPIDWTVLRAGCVHGMATWFDVTFDGSVNQRILSTAPGLPTTHWFQLRCLLQRPLSCNAGDRITGEVRLVAHNRQSYDITLTLHAPPLVLGGQPQTQTATMDLKEPYYRQLTNWQYAASYPTQQTVVAAAGTAPAAAAVDTAAATTAPQAGES